MAMPPMADMYKPKPVSISVHASGEHTKGAMSDLAKQLKPMGFSMKKTGSRAKSKKTIGDALSS